MKGGRIRGAGLLVSCPSRVKPAIRPSNSRKLTRESNATFFRVYKVHSCAPCERNEPLRFVSGVPFLKSPALSAHFSTGDRQESRSCRLATPRFRLFTAKGGRRSGPIVQRRKNGLTDVAFAGMLGRICGDAKDDQKTDDGKSEKIGRPAIKRIEKARLGPESNFGPKHLYVLAGIVPT